MANHIETFVAEYLEWTGYLVKKNMKVGRLAHGGWEMELDVVGFHPETQHLVHYEPSIDAHPWEVREKRFQKKFSLGRKYILSALFPWLPKDSKIEQFAILISHPKNRDYLAGAKIISVDEFTATVRQKITELGPISKGAIPEQFPLLRTIQLTSCGYYRVVEALEEDSAG